MRGGYFAYLMRGLFNSGKNMRLSQSLKAGRKGPLPFSNSMSLGHGPRRRHLHHKATGRNHNKAPDGELGGPQNPQHGAVQSGAESAQP